MNKLNLYTDFIKKHIVIFTKSFVLLVIFSLFIPRSFNALETYPTGDAPEYLLVTEALFNHFTPDIRAIDCETFKAKYVEVAPWNTFIKGDYIFMAKKFVANMHHKPLDRHEGIYSDFNQEKHSYHFFFYSLINLPGRYFSEWTGGNPIKNFIVTNAFLILITCFFLLFFSPFTLFLTILITLSFCFSSAYWYLGWPHPEVFTVCFVTLGCWFYFQEKHFLGLLLVTIASLQNQPLVVLMLFMGLGIVLKEKKLTLKMTIKFALIGILFLWPSIYYYMHFGTTNIIKDAGYLDTACITSTRIFGFYFDVNQGMILVIPLVLILYLFMVSSFWIKFLFKKERFNWNMLLPFFIICMSCIVATMTNWNHGQAIINRYATWFSAIILIHTFFLLKQWKEKVKLITINYIFCTQVVTILYYQQFNEKDYSQSTHTPLANWFLSYHPNWYNPDPQIFVVRTNRNYEFSEDVSPVFFVRKDNIVSKIAVNKKNIDDLANFGFPQNKINAYKQNKSFVNGWTYINRSEIDFNININKINLYSDSLRIRGLAKKIYNSIDWLNSVKQKAIANKISLDEMVINDARYLLEIEKIREK